ncbi:Gti1/Pac2 family-domain-containing protein [Mortierella sp. GBAus27b]|nr:Gti1/Pac2 family-domain-containing protein [Mortierella sp. GBAus27b]
MSIVETFHGYIETTQDTLLIFEACRRGLLPRVCRRLQEKERRIVQSGTVFVFDERESGIKRWTDGLVWSPSRILGNFLVYRELDRRNGGKKDVAPIDRASRASSSDPESATDKNRERALVGSLTNSYRFKKNGLIKKTMSIVVNGVPQHMISYYSKDDVLSGKLRTPSSVADLASLEISPEFLMKQNFRIPPTIEQSYDHYGVHSPVSSHSPRTPNGSFAHPMNTSGSDYPSTGFGYVRPKIEPDLVGTAPLDPFSKPYHQEAHQSMHPQQGYNTLNHLAGAQQQQQQQNHNPHSYTAANHSFAPGFSYSNENSDGSSTTPPSLRYLPRNQSYMSYSSQPNSQGSPSQQQQQPSPHHHQQQQQSSQHQLTYQRHSLPSSPYGASSPAMMLPSPGASGQSSNDFELHVGYHSPVTGGNNSLGGISPPGSQSAQQHYHHPPLPATTQGWGDFGYSSYPTSILNQHEEEQKPHVQHSGSP